MESKQTETRQWYGTIVQYSKITVEKVLLAFGKGWGILQEKRMINIVFCLFDVNVQYSMYKEIIHAQKRLKMTANSQSVLGLN